MGADISKNLIDQDEYPMTQAIHTRCETVHIFHPVHVLMRWIRHLDLGRPVARARSFESRRYRDHGFI